MQSARGSTRWPEAGGPSTRRSRPTGTGSLARRMLGRIASTLVAPTRAAAPGAALADGDPASDVLPSQDAFFPYAPQASKPLVVALDKVLKEIRGKDFPVKVAVIGSQADLGSYPTMF